MRVAIQGTSGAFHEFAARKELTEAPLEFIYCDSFRETFQALAENRADRVVVAIENSLYGSINEVYDLLQRHHFSITREIMLHIHQQLIGLPGASLDAITHVYSQDVALAQCQEFLASHLPQALPTEHHDTAASVEFIRAQNNPRFAAIASRFSAQHFDLPILAENIEDNIQNYTRFVVLEKQPQPIQHANKASLVLVTNHSPGALYRALGVFAEQGFNLASLHSRPIAEKAWRHKFYLDVSLEGHDLRSALHALHSQEVSVTVLGQYKQAITIFDT